MKVLTIASLVAVTLASAVTANPVITKYETIHDAARNVKRLIKDVTTGTLASVFPTGSDHAGQPFAMMEVIDAPCHPPPSITFLIMPISLNARNIQNTPGGYATYTVQTPSQNLKSPFAHRRVAFIGNMTLLRDITPEDEGTLAECYLSYHPDAKAWAPGKKGSPHTSYWARLDVDDIYYTGGFGDTHFIGHIPVEMYTDAFADEEITLARQGGAGDWWDWSVVRGLWGL